MQIDVFRAPSVGNATYSNVHVDGSLFCFGLEDVIRQVTGHSVREWKVKGETAIPEGTYECEYVLSPRFNRKMIHVMNVCGFTGILIHNGKGPESTEGCLLVSHTIEFNYERTAMLELEKLVEKAINAGQEVFISYYNP